MQHAKPIGGVLRPERLPKFGMPPNSEPPVSLFLHFSDNLDRLIFWLPDFLEEAVRRSQCHLCEQQRHVMIGHRSDDGMSVHGTNAKFGRGQWRSEYRGRADLVWARQIFRP